jgi:general secretion pathway protein C
MKLAVPSPRRFVSLINVVLVAALVVSGLLLVRDAVSFALRGTGSGTLTEEKGRVKTAGQKVRAFKAYEPILSNNVFGFPGGELRPISSGPGTAPAESQSVDVTLLGTVAWSDGFGYAIILADNGRQEVYRAGQYLKGGGILKSVYKDSILVASGGRNLKVNLADIAAIEEIKRDSRGNRPVPGGKGRGNLAGFARQTSEDSFTVDRDAVQAALADPRQIMTDARLLPNMVEGRQEGFVIREIRPGGVYQSLGLRNGDILLRVNEFDISDPETALQVFTALRGMDKVELDIVRGGSRMTLTYMMR